MYRSGVGLSFFHRFSYSLFLFFLFTQCSYIHSHMYPVMAKKGWEKQFYVAVCLLTVILYLIIYLMICFFTLAECWRGHLYGEFLYCVLNNNNNSNNKIICDAECLNFSFSVFLSGFDPSRPGHIWNHRHEEVTCWIQVQEKQFLLHSFSFVFKYHILYSA